MLREYTEALARQRQRFLEMRASLEYARKKARLKEAEEKAADPAFWEERDRAQEFMKKLGALREELRPLQELEDKLEEIEVLLELAGEDPADGQEALQEAGAKLDESARLLDRLELATLFSGDYDFSNAIVSIHPGAGGLESQDWAEMLLRMYTRWAEQKGWEVELVDLLPGEEAGIKSATMIVRGHGAYGFLQAEKGVHRLIRISPFDTARRRHTSFASVDVIPEVEEEEYMINPDDLRIDTFRSSGAGGQHVNKTDSAVRITHLPTGLVVTCQNNRSQHSNRAQAMRILQARLAEMQRREQAAELSALRGSQKEIAWGSQIRTYTFHPFTLVKDHRTGMESGQVEAVMDGALDPFIEAFLRWQARYQKRATIPEEGQS
ncbi:MAG: peptide chain release factor 2 [Dethiobacteria bacterium]|nr:peptide chain release factor 2 [Bacillota bacterium]HOB29041.1 peptide chain release factor 2 [Bacillota bacterium]HPZ41131.1 peptide chain release factor 2 [Bacillota bacterium]HQD52630.1 peptide chain release factor 2 [Bacillota bacterium]